MSSHPASDSSTSAMAVGGAPVAVPAPARPLARLRHRALSIAPREVRFDVRGFYEDATPAARVTLERHGAAFVSGFNAGLLALDPDDLAVRLLEISAEDRGFAFEGSAMAFGVLDLVAPIGRGRLGRLLGSEHGNRHVYIMHVGAGWALARLHLRPRSHLRALDPFLRWLSVDGYGFHHGFFAPHRYVHGHAKPPRVRGYERRAFDQGLGRSMWFVVGADVELAAGTVKAFPQERRADLWSGLGLAAAYTTAADGAELTRLRELSGSDEPCLAQGAAFAVAARHRAGNVVDHTRAATELLCDRSVASVVDLVNEARRGLRADPDGRDYERWRTRIAGELGRTGRRPR